MKDVPNIPSFLDSDPNSPNNPSNNPSLSSKSNKGDSNIVSVKVDADENGEGLEEKVLKRLIPLNPKPNWPNWSLDYLNAVVRCRTDGEAARKIGLSYQTVYEVRLAQADFAAAWDACRKYRDSKLVSDLEDASFKRALSCDPKDRMSASLNMFHLKARDDKYKDKAQPGGVAININLGYQIPVTKRQIGAVSDAEFEE